MTVDVLSSNLYDGTDVSEYCVNGKWHREYDHYSLQQIQDVDEPFQSLHCFVMLKIRYMSIEDDWTRQCVLIQPMERRAINSEGMEETHCGLKITTCCTLLN
jgi:hypothetical protein